MRLNRRNRRALLVVHVAASVSWLGLALALLALGIAGATAGDAQGRAAAYRAMRIVADSLVLPVSALSLLSGLVLALGTHWGLARHHWVRVKFWVSLAAAAASVFALRTVIGQAVHAVDTGTPVAGHARDLVVAPIVSTCTYAFLTAISVLKPWGPTRRGRMHPAAASTSNTPPRVPPAARREPDPLSGR